MYLRFPTNFAKYIKIWTNIGKSYKNGPLINLIQNLKKISIILWIINFGKKTTKHLINTFAANKSSVKGLLYKLTRSEPGLGKAKDNVRYTVSSHKSLEPMIELTTSRSGCGQSIGKK